MKKKTVILIVVAMLAVAFLVPAVRVSCIFWWVIMSERVIDQKISDLSQPAVYEPAGKELARLCQSDPALFVDTEVFQPAWTPAVILPHDPTWVDIQPDRASVEFGGGFHHFGYELTRSAGDTPTTNRWTLSLDNETGGATPLYTFDLDKTEQVTKQQFIDDAMAEFDRRADAYGMHESIVDRVKFLLRVDLADHAREVIGASREKSDRHMIEYMLAYVIAEPGDRDAADNLEGWAVREASYMSWLHVAYTYHATGEIDAMERSVERALDAITTQDASEPNDGIRSYLGLPMAYHLHDAGRRDTCLRLCDAMLQSDGEDDYLRAGVLSIRDGQPGSFDPSRLFDPFEGIDLKKLRDK